MNNQKGNMIATNMATLPIGMRFMNMGMRIGTVGNDGLHKGMLSLTMRKLRMA